MPPLPAPGKYIRVEFSAGDDASIEAGSRIFIGYTGETPVAADLDTFASDISTGWGDELAAFVWNTESLHGVVCTDLASDVGAEGVWEGTVDGTASTGAQLPANIAVCVNAKIARRYRGGRPRTYVRAGTTNSLATDSTNEWSSTFQSSFLTAWTAFISYVSGRSYASFSATAQANISWYNGNTVFTTPTGRARNIPVKRATPVVDAITGWAIAPKLGSQRRRLDV